MVAISSLVSEVIVKDSASAVVDRVTAALDRMANAEVGVQDGLAKSSNSLRQAASGFERLRAAADPVYASQQRLANVQAQLNRAVQLGVASQSEANAVFQKTAAQIGTTEGATSRLSAVTGALTSTYGKLRDALGTVGIALGIRELIEFGKHALETAANIDEMAHRAGLTAEQLQGLEFAALKSGESIGNIDTSIARLTRTIGEAAEGNKKAIDTFDKLHIGVLDANNAIRSTADIFLAAARAIAAIPEPAKRATAEVVLFGRSGQALDALIMKLGTGKISLDEAAKAATAAGFSFSDDLIEGAKKAEAQIELLRREAEVFAVTWGGEFLKALQGTPNALDDALKGLQPIADFLNHLIDLETQYAKTHRSLLEVLRGGADPNSSNPLLRPLTDEQAGLNGGLNPKPAPPPHMLDSSLLAGGSGHNPASSEASNKAAELAKRIAEQTATIIANTKAANDNAAAMLANGAATLKNDAIRQATIDHLKTGVDTATRSQQLLDEATAKAAEAGAAQVVTLEQQAAAARRVADAAGVSASAQEHAALQNKIGEATQKDVIALDVARGKTADQLRQEIDRTTAAIKAQDDADRNLALREKERDQTNQLALLQKETELVGANNQERAVEIAHLQALIDLHRQNGESLTAEEQRYVSNAEAIARSTAQLQQQQTAFDELGRFADQALGTIGDAITQVFATGSAKAIDFAGIVKAVIAQIVQELVALAIINPLKNLFGGTAATLGSVLGVAGGSGSAAASTGGAASGGIGSLLSPLFGGSSGGVGSFGSSFQNLIGGSAFGGVGNFLFGGAPAASAGFGAASATVGGGAGGITAGLLGTSSSFLADSFLPVVGSALPGIINGSFRQAAFGVGGAALGAAIGTFVLPFIGTAAGAAIGGLLGNLLGGLQGEMHPQAKSYFGLTPGGLISSTPLSTYTANGGSSQATDQGVSSAAQILNKILTSIGATLTGIGAGDSIRQRDDRFYGAVSGFGKHRSTDLQGAIDWFVPRELVARAQAGQLSGASPTITTILKNSPKLKTIDDLNAALNFGQTYDALVNVTKQTSQYTDQLKQLDQTYADAKLQAQQFGLSTEALDAGLAKAKQLLIGAFNDDVAQQILAFTDPLGAALAAEAKQAQQRIDDATALGADLTQVTKLNELERQQVIEQFAQQTTAQLRQLFDALTQGPLSTLSPQDQLAAAAGRYSDLVSQAASNDPTVKANALADFSGAATAYLEAARLNYASTQAYADIYAKVIGDTRTLGNIPGFASGGTAYGLSLVGERGPELADFRTPVRIYDHSTSLRMLAPANGAARPPVTDGEKAIVYEIQQLTARVVALEKTMAKGAVAQGKEAMLGRHRADYAAGRWGAAAP